MDVGYYKHHYLCIILIIIVGFILDISLGNFQEDFNKNWYFIFLRIIREILYSLQHVINKYIMDKKFCSVYELLISKIIAYIILSFFNIILILI